jgi:hypothetical protein
MSFKNDNCRAFSRAFHTAAMAFLGLVCLVGAGVILGSNWVLGQ